MQLLLYVINGQLWLQAFRVDDLPIESGMLTDALDNAQRKVESYFFDIRKQLWEYDQVLNSQRDRIYSERRKALLSESLDSLMVEYSEETMSDILEARPILWLSSCRDISTALVWVGFRCLSQPRLSLICTLLKI